MSTVLRIRLLKRRTLAEKAEHILANDTGQTVEIDDPELLRAIADKARADEGPIILIEREAQEGTLSPEEFFCSTDAKGT